jgi:hypothetical protein
MITRKEASSLTVDEQKAYVDSINTMLADPANPYGKLVAIHGNMAHNQHGMNAVGTQRFLPWHRAFLLHFEEALRTVNAKAFVPYWDWTKHKSVPKWMKALKPTVFVPGRGSVIVKRNASLQSKKNVGTIMALPDYTTFTDRLENGPHGAVHMEIGTVSGHVEAMGNIRISPADPIFWLHHAQLDRLWSTWATGHPGLGPTLSGANAKMDPWSETSAQLMSIQQLGYKYG